MLRPAGSHPGPAAAVSSVPPGCRNGGPKGRWQCSRLHSRPTLRQRSGAAEAGHAIEKLTISGDKHGTFDVKGAKVIRRELKQSSFKRQFELGDLLDGDKIKANFKDGLLSIDIPKIEPKKPDKKLVKIS